MEILQSCTKPLIQCIFAVSVYHAVYLDNLSVRTLGERVANLFSITGQQVLEIHMQGPSGIPVLVTDHVSP